MASKTADRRIEKTRKALKDALVYLIQDKSFESISIQEILDMANVGRSTFYIHYENKFELLHDCFQDFSKQLDANNKIAHSSDENNFLPVLFSFIDKNRMLAKAFLGKDGNAMLHHPIVDYIHSQVKASLEKLPSPKRPATIPVDLAVHCFTCELIGTLRWWLYTGTNSSADEISSYFKRVAYGGLKDAIGNDTALLFQ